MVVSAYAQSGSITGEVYSNTFQNKIENIRVVVEGTGKGALTDASGKYHIQNIPVGEHQLIFSAIGFSTVRQKVVVLADKSSKVSVNVPESSLELKEVTVTPKDSVAAAKHISVISQVDMKLRPVNSAQDLLRLVPGLFIAQHAGGGKAEQIFLRGFDCDHGTDFAIFVDGMPVNMVSHAHGQGFADTHWLIPETVRELDVYKGPFNAQYGDLATAGAAEFRTMNFLGRSMVKVEAGMFNTFRGLAMVNLLGQNQHLFSKQKENLWVAGEMRYSDGYFDNPQHFYRYNSMMKYYGLLSDNTSLSFSVSTFGSKWNASGQIPDRAVSEGLIGRYGSIDPSEGGNTDRTNVNIQIDHKLSGNSHITNQAYYSRYDFNLYSNFTFFLLDSIHGDEINQRDNRNLAGYKTAYMSTDRVGGLLLNSEGAVGLRYDNALVYLIHDEKRMALETISGGRLNQLNAYAYINENLYLTPKFRINPGLRYDAFSFNFRNHVTPANSGEATQARVSPKLNFFYDLDHNTELYLKSGIGFHSNDARDMIINKISDSAKNNILPRAYSAEIGSTFKAGQNALFNVAFWVLQMQSELVYNGDDGTVSPIGKTLREGIDVSFRYQATKHIYFDVDANYAHGRLMDAPANANRIPLAPEFTSIAGISYKADRGFGGSLRYRYMADRPAIEDNSLTAKGYFIMDALLNYTQKRYQVGITIENLLNTYWKEAQFATTSRLRNESAPVTEINYTPGTPFALKGSFTFFF